MESKTQDGILSIYRILIDVLITKNPKSIKITQQIQHP